MLSGIRNKNLRISRILVDGVINRELKELKETAARE